jgi:hypothetical protein
VPLINRSGTTKTIDGEEVQPGEPYIYNGPDRAALYQLWENKTDTLGTDIHQSPELLEVVRKLGFKSVKEYLKLNGYDENKVEDDFKKHAAVVNKHELPDRVNMIDTLGGGIDRSGGGLDRPGGFGTQPAT